MEERMNIRVGRFCLIREKALDLFSVSPENSPLFFTGSFLKLWALL